MNGAILGMTKAEIAAKLDEIVDFSGCERYLDTPVKRYSSGMMVRLGFAVAAHLDPEILVVDEVLAVGDAEFQKKAIGKMQDVSKGEGRTVLFVSHNMASVQRLCKTGIVLNNGQVCFHGISSQAIDYYLNIDSTKSAVYESTLIKPVQVASIKVMNDSYDICSQYTTSQTINVVLKIHNDNDSPVRGNFSIANGVEQEIIVDRFEVPIGDHEFLVTFDANKMISGSYTLNFALDIFGRIVYEVLEHIVSFDVIDIASQYSLAADVDNGLVSSFAVVKMNY